MIKLRKPGTMIYSIPYLKNHLLFVLLFVCHFCMSQDEYIAELDSNWEFRMSGDEKWLPAKVPGTVHTDLLENNIIADPYFGSNETGLQWIEKCNWEYRCFFDCSGNLLGKTNILLKFEGLDTYALVYLNDSLVITANNMFRTWETDVKSLLKQKSNKLLILFDSSVNEGIKAGNSLSYKLPGDERVFTRKAAYQYGWDWGPRFVTCGVWKPVKIMAWDNCRIENIHISTDSIDMNSLLAQLSLSLEVFSPDNSKYKIKITNQGNDKVLLNSETYFKSGKNNFNSFFEIEDAKLWWCNGIGVPYLYSLLIELTGKEQHKVIKEIKTGIRTIKLCQDENKFYFKLNGLPLIVKGANIIPPDNFLSRIPDKKYLSIINNAVVANMNMLRVWGGGVYADNFLLDYCDEKGILIWQDFMFACAMYPGDSSFTENVKHEAIDNIRRMRNHPCLALWCGNNEIDEGWHNWGWQKQYGYNEQDSAQIWNNYIKIFHDILYEAVKQNDPQHSYISTSPKIGWGHPESLENGDSHYWGVWWGMEPFDVYEKKTGNFMSEYGFQAFPDIATLSECMKKDDIRIEFEEKNVPVTSEAMKIHQKHSAGFQTIQTYMEREYRIPSGIENYIYVSQLLQAYGIKKAIDAHRKTGSHCMGTLYWQLNDCWPVVSWSSVDWYDRWKALHYFVKKAYQDTVIRINCSQGYTKCRIEAEVYNPELRSLFNKQNGKYNEMSRQHGSIQYKVIDFDGNVYKYSVVEGTATEFQLPADCSDKYPDNLMINAKYYIGKNLISEDNFYFSPPKELKLPVTKVKYTVNKTKSGFTIELSSPKLAKNVYLSVNDKNAFFSDNYFDLIPGDTVIVKCKTGISEDVFKSSLKIKSLVDCY